MKSRHIFMIVLFILMIIPLVTTVSATTSNLGTFKEGECIQLMQSCATCTYASITSVSYPNGTQALNTITPMTKTGYVYNLLFCDTNTVGTYVVDGFGDLDGSDTVFNYNFLVTKTGADSTIQKSIINILLFVLSFFIFGVLLYVGLSVSGQNKRDEMTGYIIAVSNWKYVKQICLGFAWIVAVFISYFAWMLSYAYLDMSFLSSCLQFLFYGLAIATLPFFILFVYFLIANLIRDTKIADQLSRGFEVKG